MCLVNKNKVKIKNIEANDDKSICLFFFINCAYNAKR